MRWRSQVLRAASASLVGCLAAACGRVGFDLAGGGTGDGGTGDGMVIAAPRALTVSETASCAILDDGSLWCWGWNLGALGVDPRQRIAAPARVGGDADWAAVTADAQRLCAVKTTGALWCADFGTPSPLRRIGTATDWTTVEARRSVACGLRGQGDAWCWGFGLEGALGNGSTTLVAPDPVAVATSQRFTRIAASSHVCAIDTTAALWCWGRNTRGEIGDGTTGNALSPVRIGTASWLAVAVSDTRSYGVQADGSLWAWGDAIAARPTQVGAMTGWSDVRGGDFDACALRGSELWCTGDNPQGELGTGDTRPLAALAPIDPGHAFAQVAMYARHTCAVRDGVLACTGNGGRGELGDGVQRWSATPRAMTGGPWSQLSLGYRSACGIAADASLWCWGTNDSSGLAQASDHGDASAPVAVAPGTTWAAVAVGSLTPTFADPFTFARRTDGTLWGWGIFGGSTTAAPAQIGTAAWQTMEVGLGHVCGVQAAGTLWCWGTNGFGQIGDGTANDATAPVAIGTATYQSVAAAADTSYGIRTDQSLWSWGYDGDGELGDDNRLVSVSAPARVAMNTTWTAVAGGARHACGIQTAGSLWCWGDNTSGQLGDGTTTRRPTPNRIGTGTGWLHVAAGTAHSCAIDRDGALWCWGDNSFGQLGDGTYTARLAPVRIGAGTTWVDVSATSNYGLGELDGTTCARDTAGTAWCWGDNADGLLGGGTAWSTSYRAVVR